MKWKPNGTQPSHPLTHHHIAALFYLSETCPSHTVTKGRSDLIELYVLSIIWQTRHAGCKLTRQFSPISTQPYLCFVLQHWKPLASAYFLCLYLFICAWNRMYSQRVTFCHPISIFAHSALSPSLGPICLWEMIFTEMSPRSNHIVLIIMIEI